MSSSANQVAEAQRDAAYYRDEADELKRRERERQESANRQREEQRRRLLPSNRLYHGDISDFREAVTAHVAACQREITEPHPDDDAAMRETIQRCNRGMSESIGRATTAATIYNSIMRESETRAIQALKDKGLEDWADCLETGDYSPMAI